MLNQNEFLGKNVFVAGGTSGINLGIAKAFAAAGARVSVFSRSPERVENALASLRELGAEAIGFTGDVRDTESVERALAGTYEAFGSIDVLCSGAAGNFVAPAAGMSVNGFKSVVDIDLLGSFHVLREAYQYLTKPGASIINISAPQASTATPMQAHVCAAKAGVDMLTRVLAMEWGPEGIRVNSIVPGPIDGTEGMARLTPTQESRDAVIRNLPLRRYGDLNSVAKVAVMLSSSVCDYVTGVVLPVDGGASLAGPGLFGPSA
ncbi:SDR family oxidoreductase [Alloalcanivorax gelatiniphagus]|uniref:SDR family oxidoreductase n=1 Tax=Alloalcanivorax gelatiniphagus TaxID=1194167 RepID=A0ABY2XLC7_9GAMM|nr:SDR family oxidoreductase [Alloalcanivorax gelatiniphagus]TMW12380.1 SDR family oxidoreductase [Alloalcanivorax gelatiniphagus]|tara:strand:- start:7258 stop:8046 length:789 start_codon:yes stop_codon:yes gene_type:complete